MQPQGSLPGTAPQSPAMAVCDEQGLGPDTSMAGGHQVITTSFLGVSPCQPIACKYPGRDKPLSMTGVLWASQDNRGQHAEAPGAVTQGLVF